MCARKELELELVKCGGREETLVAKFTRDVTCLFQGPAFTFNPITERRAR